eukprot:TRINITY_DN3055_c0_g1_i1.p1 TRINITY_DN3055_c0_g1~~TRINITY_DN3055_c0_g1_i1.p1  ORF type:complete len:186 (+),score=44.36 TRINITY_DN3055_c0_g1_i1:36-560(+)
MSVSPDAILENQLYLGPYPYTIEDFRILSKKFGITRVINVSQVATNRGDGFGIETLFIKVDDVPQESILPYFEETNHFLDRAFKEQQKVYVHCQAGISRSSTIVISYIMRSRNMNLPEAFAFVKERRPIINPNTGFIMQLEKYEEQLFGKIERQPRFCCSTFLQFLHQNIWSTS